jgi:DNA-binding PadR family transcriptional regulator
VLELAVLGLLHEQPLHGYELKKRLGEALGSFWGVSFGSLYPALRRLERAGAVEVVSGEEHGPTPRAPSSGSLAGDLAAARLRRRPRPTRRTRKAYRVTDAGRAMFAELLTAPDGADDERLFALRLSLCGHLAPPERLALLERRRSVLAQRLDAPVRAGRAIDRYARALLDHRARTTRHDLEWIDELIAAERDEQHPRPQGATA